MDADRVHFFGELDGNGYSITGMHISEKSTYSHRSGWYYTESCYFGLFACFSGATVKNIHLLSGSINSPQSSLDVVSICATATDSTIINCGSVVNITCDNGQPTGELHTAGGIYINIGGLVGYAGDTRIENCYYSGNIVASSHYAEVSLGGVAGILSGSGQIYNCYNAGSVSVHTDYKGIPLGGLAGNLGSREVEDNPQIVNCYNLSKYDRDGYATFGEILGCSGVSNRKCTIYNCYSAINPSAYPPVGYIAYNKKGETMTSVSTKGFDLANMQIQSNFTDFDFSSVWMMGSGDYPYPVFRWQTGAKLCKTHTYTSAGGDYCTVCGFKFEPVVTDIEDTYFYAVKNNVPIRDSYYATASKVVRRGNKDTPLLAVASLVNSVGNLWYKLNDGTYVYSENVTVTEPPRNIVYFDANGGTGVPSKCSSIGRVLISSTTIPTRPGYTFLGYSKDKNAATAQYFPGQYINEKQTLTLYAV